MKKLTLNCLIFLIFAMSSAYSQTFGLNGFIGVRDMSSQANYGNSMHFTPYFGATVLLPTFMNVAPEISVGFTQGNFGGIKVQEFDGHFALVYSLQTYESFIPFVKVGASSFYSVYKAPTSSGDENHMMFLTGAGIKLNSSSAFIFRLDFNASTNFKYDTIVHTNISVGMYLL